MPLAGKYRSKLREAIMASFDVAGLDTVLRDNDFPLNNIAIGPDFATRVNSLIDNADRGQGWLLGFARSLPPSASVTKRFIPSSSR